MAIDKSKYIIHDVPRVYTILPVQHVIYGQKWFHLTDLSKITSKYRLDYVDENNEIASIPISHLHGYFQMRGEDFWTQMVALMKDCVSAPNPFCEIWGIELYLEADASILTEQVPIGIHGSEKLDENGDSLGQMTFAEWNAGGDQPLRTSNDETKVILRTNINNVAVTQEEILIFDQFRIDNPGLGVTLLNSIQLQEKLGSVDYLQEEIT